MSDKTTPLELPVFQEVLGRLNDEEARNLAAWATAKPFADDISPADRDDALIGLTTTVCSALSENAPQNQRLQEALRTVVTEVLTHRPAVFLPPDSPATPPRPAVPRPKSFVFLPPDPPRDTGQPNANPGGPSEDTE